MARAHTEAEACWGLISAVVERAVLDAAEKFDSTEKRQAEHFLNGSRALREYCDAADLDVDWVMEVAKKRIAEIKAHRKNGKIKHFKLSVNNQWEDRARRSQNSQGMA
jgi:hypothetical protein